MPYHDDGAVPRVGGVFIKAISSMPHSNLLLRHSPGVILLVVVMDVCLLQFR